MQPQKALSNRTAYTARRAEPSALLAQPARAACVIWANCRPQGSLLRLRNDPQNFCVPSCTMLARIHEIDPFHLARLRHRRRRQGRAWSRNRHLQDAKLTVGG
ncbi:MAG: hypothetical protein ACOYOU_19960, partial [Kiritimatiellia bacterium]